MNMHRLIQTTMHGARMVLVIACAAALLGPAGPAGAVPIHRAPMSLPAARFSATSAPPCSSIAMSSTATITLGKSTLVRLPQPAIRVLIGGLPGGASGKPVPESGGAKAGGIRVSTQPQASTGPNTSTNGVGDSDVMLLSPSELYLLGKRAGTMNVIVQSRNGQCTVLDVTVAVDPTAMQSELDLLLPEDKGIKVQAASDSYILTGVVRDTTAVGRAMSIAEAYAPKGKVINMLHVSAPQQVMLDVKVAEISKTLLDSLGAEIRARGAIGGWSANLFSAGGSILDSAAAAVLSSDIGVFTAIQSANRLVAVNAENNNGIVRVLAEPNIMTISGQEASFLSGGKIFIPVSQTNAISGVPTITLEEKSFGVGLKFVPIVLNNGNINLRISSEVSELSQTGSPFTTVGGVTAVLPTFTTRSAQTTVQLGDGQSFAIAGMIQNNANETIKRVPGLGDLPVLGALFRSSQFQKNQTELVFVITPHLVKPLPAHYALPTDRFVTPSYTDFFLKGQMEGSVPPASAPATPASAGGFEMH